MPRRKPRNLSVVIPFRDKPDLTIKSVRSVFTQRTSFPVTVILVSNQSTREVVEQIRRALDHGKCGGRYTIIDYNEAFNHSAQCNMGVAAAGAEVVVLLNNDATLQSDQTLEEMGAWALVRDVGSVGIRILDSDDRLLSAGLRYRERLEASCSSPMEEVKDPSLAECIRETAGNTFAAAAIATQTFDELGGLNSVSFPNGLNDVEFSLRAREAGYIHIYLGHLAASHLRGKSRGTSDETLEAVRLRQEYPCTAGWALEQLETETRQEPVGFWGRRLRNLRGILTSRRRRLV